MSEGSKEGPSVILSFVEMRLLNPLRDPMLCELMVVVSDWLAA
jgi:hypothetical protein